MVRPTKVTDDGERLDRRAVDRQRHLRAGAGIADEQPFDARGADVATRPADREAGPLDEGDGRRRDRLALFERVRLGVLDALGDVAPRVAARPGCAVVHRS